MSKVLRYALDYARHGWHVLPLTPGDKMPFGQFAPNGVKNATTDEETIERWFSKSKCNLGIATGPQSKIWVIDIDGPVGCLVWWEWEANHGHAFTLAQRTGRHDGGRQLIFQYPEDYTIKTRANIRTGIDVRGENGYIVAPPSIHPSGSQYVWEGKIPINPAPIELLKLVGKQRLPTTAKPISSYTNRPSSSGTNYGRKVAEDLRCELSSCARGGRDQLGYRVAVRLLELEISGDIGPGTAEFILRAGLTNCGYMDDKRHERGERGLQRLLSSARRKING